HVLQNNYISCFCRPFGKDYGAVGYGLMGLSVGATISTAKCSFSVSNSCDMVPDKGEKRTCPELLIFLSNKLYLSSNATCALSKESSLIGVRSMVEGSNVYWSNRESLLISLFSISPRST